MSNLREAVLIFPNQIFKEHPGLSKERKVFIAEEALFFRQYKFHKKKLLLHRASMKFYESHLKKKGYEIIYIESASLQKTKNIFEILKKNGIKKIHFTDVNDDWLDKRIYKYSSEFGIETEEYESPMFLNGRKRNEEYFSGREKYLMANFYKMQRKYFGILINESGNPTGNKWSFDGDNRKKLPAKIQIPEIWKPAVNKFVRESIDYVNLNFMNNYGDTENFIYPVTFEDAEKWYFDFLENRFFNFGYYEDSISTKHNFIFHSLLSPLINTGLLTPEYIIDNAINFSKDSKIPLNSLEGFIRQIIGWREFIRGVYTHSGSKQRNSNFWSNSNKLPASFYNGTTMLVPLDKVIKSVMNSGYCHHIERLMITGNVMLLCEISPNEVYKWFMELFTDAYDWVMVPNVYGMSQFADGGMMASKPYISGSNYILKMSDYKKGEWCEIWNSLYWRFIFKHKNFFASNHRLSLTSKMVDKMERAKLERYINTAETFLERLF